MSNKKRTGIIRKFKKQSKPLRIILLIVGAIYALALAWFSKSTILLTGIETPLRVTVLIVLYLLLFIYLISSILLLFTHKKKSLISLFLFYIIISLMLGFVSYYIDKTYGIIDNVQKEEITYKSVLVSLKEKDEYERIGIISNEDDPTGYIIPMDMIEEYKIDKEK